MRSRYTHLNKESNENESNFVSSEEKGCFLDYMSTVQLPLNGNARAILMYLRTNERAQVMSERVSDRRTEKSERDVRVRRAREVGDGIDGRHSQRHSRLTASWRSLGSYVNAR
jgi:hypothetical protein